MKNSARTLFLFLFLTQMIFAQNSKVYEYKNGLWYSGSSFVEGTWYVQNGVFTQKTPAKVDSVINLDKRWVVPPMGDAHCASVSGKFSTPSNVNMYAQEGVFYLQVLNNSKDGRKKAETMLNKANTPDVSFANGGLTCTFGYPFLKYESENANVYGERLVNKLPFLKEKKYMAGDGYWFFDQKDDINLKWDSVLLQKPAIISIYLLDAQNMGGKEGKGLTPDMAKALVKKAHKSNLRVYAHVETADDVRLGIKLGVDGFANLPGHDWNGQGDSTRYILKDGDIKKLAKQKTVVIPAFGHAMQAGNAVATRNLQAAVLNKMFKAGVNIAIGSADEQRTTFSEINQLKQLSPGENARFLTVLCQNTPQAIFPNRKIGKIEEGYEASFLALLDNPLDNIQKIRAISFKVKNGVLLK